jgi:fermentation-respiration switch protein FrsA (DUF1100 family)
MTINGSVIFSALWTAVRIAAIAYAALAFLVYLRQASLVYHPLRALEATPAHYGLDFEDLHLTAEDGVSIHAWFIPAPEARGTLLICHGNAGNISHRLQAIQFYRSLGLDVLIFDYRGFGQSGGRPSEKGTYRDARAAWNYLTETRGIPPRRIVVFGRSLGGPIAARLAQEEEPAALWLEATFVSIPTLAAQLYPYLPVKWLCRFRYDALEAMRQARCPVLVAHSAADEMIPFSHGCRLFVAAPEPKEFIDLSGSHNDGETFFTADYRRKLNAFLERALAPADTPAR